MKLSDFNSYDSNRPPQAFLCREMAMGMPLRKLVRWSITIFVCVNLLGLLYDLWPKRFTRERWQSGHEVYRGSIVTDLVERRIIVGRSRFEVSHLLGAPDQCYAHLPHSSSVACTDERADRLDYRFLGRRCHFVWGCTMMVGFNTSSQTVDSVTLDTGW